MTRFHGVMALTAVLAVAHATQASEAPRREITTSGQTVLQVVPDEVVVGAGVETFHVLLDRAKQDNDAQSERLLKAVKSLGIDEGDIQTDVLYVDLEYKVRDDPGKGIEGYHARRSYSIVLRDTRRLEALVDAILKNGGNRLAGLQFRTSKLRSHRDEARRLAIRAAREKADSLAGELGAKVGAPLSIQEESTEGWWPGYPNTSNVGRVVEGPDGGGETLPSGRIAVRAGVKVSFDLITP
jgi:uncharacterized protein YggE